MVYKLIITSRAEELLDNLVYHLLFRKMNEQAAKHLLNEIGKIYDRLEENPYQFPISRDYMLSKKEYREAIIPDMNYVVIYRIDKEQIYVMGVFHQLEDYRRKV